MNSRKGGGVRLALVLLAGFLLGVVAPVVTIFYRGGWFDTPDDPVPPRGTYEPFVKWLHDTLGPWLSDWYWLGWRNRAYGFAYAMKPDIFKDLRYESIELRDISLQKREFGPFVSRKISVLGYEERTYTVVVSGVAVLCIIVGYRLRPIWEEVTRNRFSGGAVWDVPHRPVNMDARPIFSLRPGDDD